MPSTHSGRGAVTAVAASADAVVVVTSRAYLLRYDVASGGPPVEVELVPASARRGGAAAGSSSSASSSSPAATGVWLDPATGSHAVVAVDGLNGASGALYVHAGWRKPRALSLTGVGGGSSNDTAAAQSSSRLSAAAFDDASVTEGNTGPVLVATSAGVLSSFSFDERDKRERSSGKLYSFAAGGKGQQGPVGGVALARVGSNGTKRVALVATAERLFVFSAQLPSSSSSSSSSGGERSNSSSSLEPLFSTCSPDPLTQWAYATNKGAGRSFLPPTTFPWTGKLRPEKIGPTRAVPEGIALPDYARSSIPFSEQESRQQHSVPIRTEKEIARARAACRIGREVLDEAARAVRPGVTTDEIDRVVHEATVERGAYPSPLNYYSFPKSVCTSVNEVVCHGIPDAR